MINGNPPFMGDSQIEQLIEIIKILGTPTKQEVQEMNRVYDMKEYIKFPKVKATPWKNVLVLSYLVVADEGSAAVGFDNEGDAVLANQKDNACSGTTALIFRRTEKLSSFPRDAIQN
jgi:hypothetical protein